MVYKSIALLLVAVNLLIRSSEARAKMKQYIWLQDLKPCGQPRDFDSNKPYLNTSFRYIGQGEFLIDIDVFAPRQIDHLYFFVNLKKCPTTLETDDCEEWLTFPGGDQCDESNAYFRYLYNKTQPPLSCPIMGQYHVKNLKLDFDKHSTFFRGLSEEQWLHGYLNIYSDENKLESKEGCIFLTAKMKKLRVLEKSNSNKKQK
ncbi:uncharacterized protein [Halyomorpha halys]|uniref:uncharacterized protein n=1 Tax=Halyomorpha halys TaxID=286706 RepID=UPI0006D4CDFC|nr:uncharacterized protein LOC106690365 [Halyomorpha halys]